MWKIAIKIDIVESFAIDFFHPKPFESVHSVFIP